MKKVFITRLIGLLALLVNLPVYAYDFESGGIYYNIDGDNVTVTSGDSKYQGDVTIPSQVAYNGKTYSVTSIGERAFIGCSSLTSMTIPNSVTTIGSEAFYECSGLTSVTIPNSVTSIDGSAFYKCSGLTSITIPNSVTSIGGSAFYGTAWYDNQPDGLVYAGKFAYRYKGNMPANTHITIKDGTLGIAGSAFYKCIGLASITIPNSVTSIGSEAFYKCTGLTSMVIPNSVTSISSGAFIGCSSLTSITIPNSVTSIGYGAFSGCTGLTSVTIPNSVTSVGYSAFSGCTGLISVTIPNSVASIGESAFYKCSGLTSVAIPNHVEIICPSTFQDCSSLTSITIPKSVSSIGYDAFRGCSSLTSVHITDLKAWCETYNGSLMLDYHLYLNGVEIKDLVIPEGVTSIHNFYNCSSLTSLTIPNSVTSISGDAFSGCSGLASIKVESGNPRYDSRNDCNAIIETSSNTLIVGCKNTIIPNSVTSIGFPAFYGCSSLTSVTIPNSVTSIGGDAFRNCSGLTSITIPNSVTNIGDYAFLGTAWYDNQPDGLVYAGKVAYKYKGNMPSNTHITIKDGTLGIVGEAFLYYSGLTSVTIPNSLTSIGSSAFFGCTGLTTITSEIEKPFEINSNTFSDDTYTNVELIVPKGTKALYQATEGWNKFTRVTEAAGEEEVSEFSVDGIYYKVGENNTVFVISGDVKYSGDIVIPEQVTFNGKTYSVTSIGRSAFNGCGDLISITIPNSVTSIEWEAFDNCSGLTSIIIPNSVTSIGKYAFSGCSGITSLTISNTLSSISGNAFQLCSSLTSVIIPNSVSVINDEAFYGCTGLTTIIIPNSVAWIGEAFRESKGLTTIISGIENPFELYPWAFSEDTYKVAELIVPKGTKALYQSTKGWNKFTKITEAADKDEANFAINGVTYQGTKSSKTVVVKAVDTKQMSVEIPASVSYDGTTYQVTGIADDAFKGSNMAALVWNVDAALPNNAFSNALIGSNFLLYVKQTSFAPSSIKNVIANGTAQKIVLSDDGGQFYCPQAFTARSISYTHNYSMETDIGKAKGWETLALPFDVQKILHSTRGEIVPFPSYNSSSIQKPFWLANFSGNGFRRTAAVLANEPYIIAMPNSKNYRNDYNLAGEVTFSADNVQVPKTPSFSGTFVPAFGTVPQSSTVYALNVNNRHVKYSGNYDAGSRFIANLRDVRPFEAYISNSSTRGIIEINFDDGTTDMFDILLPTDENQEVTIHTLSGQQITRITQRDFETIWQQLPKGVYIVNGKKWIK